MREGMSIRAVLRDVAIYGSADAVLRASAFLTLPIYTRVFEPGEYGLWSVVVTFTFLLNTVLLLGGDAAYGRFFFTARDRRELEVLTSTIVLLLAGVGCAIVALLLPLSGTVSDWSFGTGEHGDLVVLALLAGPVVVVNTLLGQVLRNEFRAGLFALLNVITAVLGVALSLYLILELDFGVEGVLAGGLAAALLVLPVRLWVVRSLLRPVFSMSVARRLLAFGLPLVPAAAAGWVMSVSDRIVLGKLADLREVGLYAVAASVASVLTFLNAPLGEAWGPHAVQAYERDSETARDFYGRVLTYIVLAFGFLAVAVTAFGRELLSLLTQPEYASARAAIAPLALAAVAFATIQVTSAAISMRHKTWYIAAVTAVAASVNLLLNVLLVPIWGMRASAWATAATALLLTVAYGAISYRLWPVRYETRRLVAVGATTVAFTLGAQALPDLALAAAIPAQAAYCLAYVGVLLSLGGIDRRETRAAWSVLAGLPLLRPRRS